MRTALTRRRYYYENYLLKNEAYKSLILLCYKIGNEFLFTAFRAKNWLSKVVICLTCNPIRAYFNMELASALHPIKSNMHTTVADAPI